MAKKAIDAETGARTFSDTLAQKLHDQAGTPCNGICARNKSQCPNV